MANDVLCNISHPNLLATPLNAVAMFGFPGFDPVFPVDHYTPFRYAPILVYQIELVKGQLVLKHPAGVVVILDHLLFGFQALIVLFLGRRVASITSHAAVVLGNAGNRLVATC